MRLEFRVQTDLFTRHTLGQVRNHAAHLPRELDPRVAHLEKVEEPQRLRWDAAHFLGVCVAERRCFGVFLHFRV